MSLIITLYVPEGIVLAGDSRLTLNWSEKNNNGESVYYSVNGSDTNNKIFKIRNKFGLGTFGAADISGVPIAGFINQFIEEKIGEDSEIDEVPNKLLEFFGNKYNDPKVNFYVAGYKIEKGISVQHVYFINIAGKNFRRVNQSNDDLLFGGHWGGEIEVLQRLMQNIKIKDGADWKEVVASPIPYNFLTLQDAIDFCEYGIKTTIETMRFQRRAKTVGGSVDIMVIRPNTGIEWIRKKDLK